MPLEFGHLRELLDRAKFPFLEKEGWGRAIKKMFEVPYLALTGERSPRSLKKGRSHQEWFVQPPIIRCLERTPSAHAKEASRHLFDVRSHPCFAKGTNILD